MKTQEPFLRIYDFLIKFMIEILTDVCYDTYVNLQKEFYNYGKKIKCTQH